MKSSQRIADLRTLAYGYLTVYSMKMKEMLSSHLYEMEMFKIKKKRGWPGHLARQNTNTQGTGYSGRLECFFEQHLHPFAYVLLLQN